ncbi:MAG: hypothetical protein IMZ62_02915 [Chloroflexi bacterium]|nr:hypothetical protein [Chloroflexota bacterium]
MQIPDEIRRCVVFLYASGTARRRPVGTGFFASIYRPDVPAPREKAAYLVTAKHVVEGVRRAGEELYARVNGRGPLEMALWATAGVELEHREQAGEKTDILRVFEDLRAKPPESVLRLAKAMADKEPSLAEGAQFVDLAGEGNWIFHEDPNVDLAVLDWRPPSTVDVSPFPLDQAVTPALIAREGIGLGDDVFVVGLFSRRTGQARNIPIIRVGNIVAMPEEPIETETGLQEAYLVELLSIGGLSGSPVFTYLGGIRREFPLGGEITLTTRAGAIHLLGLVHGHWNLASEERVDAVRDELDGGERVNMGIAIVVPIARLLEILDYSEVRAAREKAQE